MKVLVLGGAGYIGSHAVIELLEKGYEVLAADNLEVGHREAVSKDAEFVQGDLRDKDFTSKLFSEHPVSAVINFAAYTQVAESVANPLKYYENNVGGMLNVLTAMKKYGVREIVFSSTASVYGEPKFVPIPESAATDPKNPYGESKLTVEKALKWTHNSDPLFSFAAMRYFNVAGAHKSGEIGEDHRPESHLIPLVLRAAMNPGIPFTVYGNDYDTPDGTCIRDYIHVSDLARAHVLALEKLARDGGGLTYNLGNGKGFSNMEIIKAAENVTGGKINRKFGERRPGDPSVLIASSEKITAELNFAPKYGSLEEIIETAWRWHKNRPNGYGA